MEEEISDWLIIDNIKAAKALSEPRTRRYLEPFIGREQTVTEAAKALGVSGNSLLYRVKQFAQLGLLKAVREVPRVGKAIKVYQASADLFFVPFALTPAETLEALVLPLEASWQQDFVRSAAWACRHDSKELGLGIWRGESGDIYTKPTLPPPTPLDTSLLERFPVLSIWTQLHLDAESTYALQLELLELFERYSKFGGKTQHILHLGLSPWHSGKP